MVSACYSMCVSIQTGFLIFSKMCDSISVEVELREDNILGASLGIRKPHELIVPELKRWLACRSRVASWSGNKAALIERVNDYIKSGARVDPDSGFILN